MLNNTYRDGLLLNTDGKTGDISGLISNNTINSNIINNSGLIQNNSITKTSEMGDISSTFKGNTYTNTGGRGLAGIVLDAGNVLADGVLEGIVLGGRGIGALGADGRGNGRLEQAAGHAAHHIGGHAGELDGAVLAVRDVGAHLAAAGIHIHIVGISVAGGVQDGLPSTVTPESSSAPLTVMLPLTVPLTRRRVLPAGTVMLPVMV